MRPPVRTSLPPQQVLPPQDPLSGRLTSTLMLMSTSTSMLTSTLTLMSTPMSMLRLTSMSMSMSTSTLTCPPPCPPPVGPGRGAGRHRGTSSSKRKIRVEPRGGGSSTMATNLAAGTTGGAPAGAERQRRAGARGTGPRPAAVREEGSSTRPKWRAAGAAVDVEGPERRRNDRRVSSLARRSHTWLWEGHKPL